MDPSQDQPQNAGATFRVRFQVAHMSAKQNKLFSLLPIPFFIGLPGFRSKLWTLNEASGVSQGIYQWDTVQDATNYAHSFAMKFMAMRPVPGSISCSASYSLYLILTLLAALLSWHSSGASHTGTLPL